MLKSADGVLIMFFDRIELLCKKNNISPTDFVENELHMSRSNVTKWKEGKTPKSSTVSKVALFFGVTTDYLLGNEQKNKPPMLLDDLEPYELELIKMLREGPEEITDAVYRLAGIPDRK